MQANLRMAGIVVMLTLASSGCRPAGTGRSVVGGRRAGAPAGAGLCWRSTTHGGRTAFSVLSRGDPNLETCAMHLEVTRRMHDLPAVSGAYQGQYLYADAADIVSTPSLSTPGYSVLTKAQRQDMEDQITTLLQAQTPATPATTSR